jgi:hypothetical protein
MSRVSIRSSTKNLVPLAPRLPVAEQYPYFLHPVPSTAATRSNNNGATIKHAISRSQVTGDLFHVNSVTTDGSKIEDHDDHIHCRRPRSSAYYSCFRAERARQFVVGYEKNIQLSNEIAKRGGMDRHISHRWNHELSDSERMAYQQRIFEEEHNNKRGSFAPQKMEGGESRTRRDSNNPNGRLETPAFTNNVLDSQSQIHAISQGQGPRRHVLPPQNISPPSLAMKKRNASSLDIITNIAEGCARTAVSDSTVVSA